MKVALPILCCIIGLVMASLPAVSAAPASPDYESVRELYELLYPRSESGIDWQHRLVRKNNRSPQLRLRFGRRSDPTFGQGEHILDHSIFDSVDN